MTNLIQVYANNVVFTLESNSSSNRADINQFLVLQYDCMPNLKHCIGIDKLQKIVNALQAGTGKNPTTVLYSETTKPENFSMKQGLKKSKNGKTSIKIMHTLIMLKS